MSQNKITTKLERNIKEGEKMEIDNTKNKNENKNEVMKNNIITGRIKVLKNKLKLRILNSNKKNEKDIKECEIFINDKKISFSYHYVFLKKGYYTIKYEFNSFIIL